MAHALYHPGELEMQRSTGEEIAAYRNSRIVTPYVAGRAVPFIEEQPFVAVSSQDGQGNIWTSLLSGAAGYVRVKDEQTIALNKRLVHTNPADRFWENITVHPAVGMLFIELATRQRYRVNGRVSQAPEAVLIAVRLAYVNCPKYIQRRTVTVTLGEQPVYSAGEIRGTTLTGELMDWIQAADTFFVGSSDGADGMDASHRGGHPGFVEVVDATTLRVPDYQGNSMYNTLGNFRVNPRAGLLFIDFTGQRTLQLTGAATVHQRDPAPDGTDTGRSWTFVAEEWVLLENLRDMQWTFLDYSPFNPS